jgi:hypothetical protein
LPPILNESSSLFSGKCLTRLLQYDFISIVLARGYGDAKSAWHHAPISIRGVVPSIS